MLLRTTVSKLIIYNLFKALFLYYIVEVTYDEIAFDFHISTSIFVLLQSFAFNIVAG